MRQTLEELAPRVYRFALKLTGDADSASDLTQEAMLRAWCSRGKLRQPGAGRVWVFRIAANLWRDTLRRKRIVESDSGWIAQQVDPCALGPDQQAQQREQLQRVLHAMDALPPRQRQVLYLSVCESLSVAQIAEVLQVSPGAVKASLSLARGQMRSSFRDLVDDCSFRKHGTS